MEKYRRVENKDKNQPQSKDQIRIRAGDNSIYPYLSYAHRHFSEANNCVIIKAAGNAISRAVQVVELIKRKFKGLHQKNEISSLEVEDIYEPVEQGLDIVTRTRRLTMFVCTLSLEPIDQDHYGYQEPLPAQQVQLFQPRPQRGAPRHFRSGPRYHQYRGGYWRGRGGGNPRDYERGPRYRGGRGRGYGGGYRSYEDDYQELEYGYERSRDRGFRGFRGARPRGRGEGYRRDYDDRRYYESRRDYEDMRDYDDRRYYESRREYEDERDYDDRRDRDYGREQDKRRDDHRREEQKRDDQRRDGRVEQRRDDQGRGEQRRDVYGRGGGHYRDDQGRGEQRRDAYGRGGGQGYYRDDSREYRGSQNYYPDRKQFNNNEFGGPRNYYNGPRRPYPRGHLRGHARGKSYN